MCRFFFFSQRQARRDLLRIPWKLLSLIRKQRLLHRQPRRQVCSQAFLPWNCYHARVRSFRHGTVPVKTCVFFVQVARRAPSMWQLHTQQKARPLQTMTNQRRSLQNLVARSLANRAPSKSAQFYLVSLFGYLVKNHCSDPWSLLVVLSRTFNSEMALQAHSKAKHGAKWVERSKRVHEGEAWEV